MEATLVGVFIGFLLSQGATLMRDWFTTRKQNHSVRTTLEIEMDRNLELLDLYWKRVNEDASVKRFPISSNPTIIETQDFAMRFGHAIISSYIPNWSHLMLESQLSHLASALTPEEIKNVHAFHWQLDDLTTVFDRLQTMENRYMQRNNANWGAPGGFRDERALPVVEKFETIFSEILAKGNPLAPKHPQSKRVRFHLPAHTP